MNKKENIMLPPENLILPEWKEGDGPAPYVWNSLPKGNRCAWACTWVVKHPTSERHALRIGPIDWTRSTPDLMTDEQLLAEIGDMRNTNRALEVYRLLDAYEDTPSVIWRKAAEKLVREMRDNFISQREYVVEIGAPADVAFQVQSAGGTVSLKPPKRPGWDMLYLEER